MSKFFAFIGLLTAAVCFSLQSCNDFQNSIADLQPEVISTRSDASEMHGDKFEVTQRMAEIFISSNKDNPPIISIVPFNIDGVTCFYIFNFEKGFKVVSADTRVQPILAESDRESLVPSETDNPGVKFWLEDTADRIKVLKENNPDTGEDYTELWSAYRIPANKDGIQTRSHEVDSVWILVHNTSEEVLYNNANVGPLLSTKWGQGSPWNAKMPMINGIKCKTGCVAVATAQVLYYFHYQNNIPKDFWETISIQNTSTCCITHGGVNVTLNKSNYVSDSSRWLFMAEDRYNLDTDYVSELMLDLGERLNMHYGTGSSAVIHASDLSIPQLSSCGLSYSFDTYTFQKVKNNSLTLKPVIISGWTANPGSSGAEGHTWVIDGCRDYSIRYTTTVAYHCIHVDQLVNYSNYSDVLSYDEMMSMYPDASGGVYQLSYSVSYDNQQSLHMNWGWDGNSNGWYNLLNNEWQSYSYCRVIHNNLSASQLN